MNLRAAGPRIPVIHVVDGRQHVVEGTGRRQRLALGRDAVVRPFLVVTDRGIHDDPQTPHNFPWQATRRRSEHVGSHHGIRPRRARTVRYSRIANCARKCTRSLETAP